jgi:drug/metabolite transporter (DMT)-like permease
MENVFMLRPPSISLVSTMPAVSRRVAPIDVLLLLMAIIWGTNYAIIKHAFTEMDPQAFNALRMTVASSTFVAVMAWMQWRECRRGAVAGPESSLASIFHTPERVTGREWLGLAGLGVVGHYFYQYCFISGLSQTSVANSALLIAATPVLIAIITGVFGREPVGWRHWAGAALSLIGIYIVVGQGASIGGSSLRGDLMMSAAVVCWTIYTLGARPLMRRHSPVGVTGISMLIGSVLYVPAVSSHLRSLNFAKVSGVTWFSIVYSALFALCVAYTIWYAAVREIGSARTSIYSNLVPIVAMFTAVVFLGESLGPRKIIGAVAVLAGVALTRLGAPKVVAPPCPSA